MAYVDGMAAESVVQHVSRCPACARQVEEFAAVQAALTTRLYRFSCPAAEQLIAYQHGELVGSEHLLVAQHLRQCPHCARELATLARDERQSLGERLRVAFESLEAALAMSQAQVAGVRGIPGKPRSVPQVYRAGEIEVIVHQHPSRVDPHRPDLSGLVHIGGRVPEDIGPSASSGQGGARVELYRDGGLIAITPVSSRGQFTFAAVDPGDYELSLLWGSREVWLRGVQVG